MFCNHIQQRGTVIYYLTLLLFQTGPDRAGNPSA